MHQVKDSAIRLGNPFDDTSAGGAQAAAAAAAATTGGQGWKLSPFDVTPQNSSHVLVTDQLSVDFSASTTMTNSCFIAVTIIKRTTISIF